MKCIELAHHQHSADRTRDLFFADGHRISKARYDALSAAPRMGTILTQRRSYGWRHTKSVYFH